LRFSASRREIVFRSGRIIMGQQLAERLQGVEVAEPVEAGGLQGFALRWDAGAGADYLTLD